MRKLLLLLGILAAFGILPGVASAANCASIQTSKTGWNGLLNFTGYISACTVDVNEVQFGNANTYLDSWYDLTRSEYIDSSSTTGAETDNVNTDSSVYRIYSHASWCGGAADTVSTNWQYRIHDTNNGGSWGSWHEVVSSWYAINC
jgi:hypothetical protein